MNNHKISDLQRMFSLQRPACVPVMQIFPNSFIPFQTQQNFEATMNQPSYHLIIPIGIKKSQTVECTNCMNGVGFVFNTSTQQITIGNKSKVNFNVKHKLHQQPKKNTTKDESSKVTKTPRKKFSPEEDEKLRSLVEKMGSKKWEIIAKDMPGRTGRQCRDRYQNYLIPGFFNGQWSKQEDDLLLKKFIEYGSQWSKITPFFKNRSANALKNRWNYFVSRHSHEISNEYIQNAFAYSNMNDSINIQTSEIDTKEDSNENTTDVLYENVIYYSNPYEFMDIESMGDNGELICKDESHDFPFSLID